MSNDIFIDLEDLPGEEATIQSLNYPYAYEGRIFLTWHFRSRLGKKVQLHISDAQMKVRKKVH